MNEERVRAALRGATDTEDVTVSAGGAGLRERAVRAELRRPER